MAAFLKRLARDVAALLVLSEIMEASDNWRFREHLASQIAGLAELFSVELVSQHIVPLLFELNHDSVAHVRNVANKAVCMALPCPGEAG